MYEVKSEFQIIIAEDGTTLAHVRSVNSRLADSYYLREHCPRLPQDEPCLCQTCRSRSE